MQSSVVRLCARLSVSENQGRQTILSVTRLTGRRFPLDRGAGQMACPTTDFREAYTRPNTRPPPIAGDLPVR